jgi:hypothetical protein
MVEYIDLDDYVVDPLRIKIKGKTYVVEFIPAAAEAWLYQNTGHLNDVSTDLTQITEDDVNKWNEIIKRVLMANNTEYKDAPIDRTSVIQRMKLLTGFFSLINERNLREGGDQDANDAKKKT